MNPRWARPLRWPASLRVAAALAACAVVVGLFYRHAPAPWKAGLHVLSAQLASFNLGYRPSPSPARQKVSSADGMAQVYIPAGEFTMGTDDRHYVASYPEHKVYLGAFWMDRTAVTNAMYARCVAAKRCQYIFARPGFNPQYADPFHRDQPVTFVSWKEASRYCAWAGRRLPTEAEWEKAARGTDARLYPWGSALPDVTLLNFANNIGSTVSVFRYPRGASPYGVLQLEGNIREWMRDWFDPSYYSVSPYKDPQGPVTGTKRVLRGASFDDNARQVLVFVRFDHTPTSRGANRGFRCAESAPN